MRGLLSPSHACRSAAHREQSTSPLKPSRAAGANERERALMRTDHLLDLQHWAEIRALCGMLVKVRRIFNAPSLSIALRRPSLARAPPSLSVWRRRVDSLIAFDTNTLTTTRVQVGGIFCRAPELDDDDDDAADSGAASECGAAVTKRRSARPSGRVSSHVLGGSMRNIERRYFKTFNSANCRSMRDALGRDNWRPLPSEALFAHGGLRGVLKLQSLGFGGKASAVMEAATAVMLSSGGGDAAARSSSSSSAAAAAIVETGDEGECGGGGAEGAAAGGAGEGEGEGEVDSPRTRAKKTTLESMNVLELFALRGNPFSDDFFELLASEMSECGESGSAVRGVTHDVVVDETDWSSLVVTSTATNCFAKVGRRCSTRFPLYFVVASCFDCVVRAAPPRAFDCVVRAVPPAPLPIGARLTSALDAHPPSPPHAVRLTVPPAHPHACASVQCTARPTLRPAHDRHAAGDGGGVPRPHAALGSLLVLRNDVLRAVRLTEAPRVRPARCGAEGAAAED
jgi:hypothetical protein